MQKHAEESNKGQLDSALSLYDSNENYMQKHAEESNKWKLEII